MLEKPQKREVERRIDVPKVVYILRTEGYLLPQTNGASSMPYMLVGMLMVGFAMMTRTRARKQD